MCAAPVAIKGCCGVHAGLPGTNSDQIPRVPGGKRCGTSPTWLRDGVMKIDYMCTSNAKPRGEMRARPAEKRTAAARASRCTRPRSYTGPGAGCLAPPGQGRISRHGRKRPAASKLWSAKRWISTTSRDYSRSARVSGLRVVSTGYFRVSPLHPGLGASFVAGLRQISHKS